jgi:hypothetical protein
VISLAPIDLGEDSSLGFTLAETDELELLGSTSYRAAIPVLATMIGVGRIAAWVSLVALEPNAPETMLAGCGTGSRTARGERIPDLRTGLEF